ncbi:somatostatin receptor type 5-like [Nerophis ophidion]|uniref:somatostatin receptor type 5-like n=1 Tax=Nerophis ophidion TaxID=159077 RepID=UPI002ADFAFB5|nr:somatostatin receptor type 5-like [Nerophis ophidion]XP_061741116.1 somatostatin receptor type 5-like [Nerophis ophidion]XP_061741117.1 somatostatin receptor type 5-like [Nerophis ophidion]XP_061741118.1 somatostatin receptor type 5-like [Nerophis ophidion]XP_061741120.1 somatostatin receptor type 5-like [Nerophis ophidion]
MADDNMTFKHTEDEANATGYSANMTDMSELMPFGMVTAVVYGIVFIVGLLGNTLAIFVVIRYSKMKTVTNMYILNLALADELYILGIPFLATNSVLSYWPYGDFFCKVCMTADAMSQFTSTFCLTVMSIDRYLAVVHPIRSAKWRRPQVAKIFSVTLWVVSFLVVLPVTIYSHVQEGLNTCNITWPEMQNWWSVVFILYTSILGFFGPLLVITICYLLIVIKVRSAGVRAGVTKRRRSERKATRMVVIIVGVFVFCWMPFFTTNIVNLVYIIPENNATAAIYFFLVILTYVNSCANPVLYGFLSDNFKQSFQKVLCFHKNPTTVDQRKARQGAPRETSANRHDPLFSNRNPTDNGKVQNIQDVEMKDVGNLDNESSTIKKILNGQSTQ